MSQNELLRISSVLLLKKLIAPVPLTAIIVEKIQRDESK